MHPLGELDWQILLLLQPQSVLYCLYLTQFFQNTQSRGTNLGVVLIAVRLPSETGLIAVRLPLVTRLTSAYRSSVAVGVGDRPYRCLVAVGETADRPCRISDWRLHSCGRGNSLLVLVVVGLRRRISLACLRLGASFMWPWQSPRRCRAQTKLVASCRISLVPGSASSEELNERDRRKSSFPNLE